MTIQLFAIGTSYGTIANVESLTTTPNMAPRVTYQAYSDVAQLAGGGSKNRGTPIILWDWGFIPTDLFNALRVLVPNASAALYIRSRLESGTIDSSGAYTYYTANCNWPELDSYEFKAGTYRPFQLRFTQCVVYTP